VPDRGEFELIADLFAPLAARNPGALGLRDDAALLDLPPGCQAVSTVDAMVEGVHFFPEDAADLVGQKLLRVSLSDLAAMGATPLSYFLTLVRPSTISETWLQRFVRGLADDQQEFGISVAGGDTVSTSGPLVLSLTAIGFVKKGQAIERRGSTPGDDLYVSGTIGDAGLGLELVQGNIEQTFQALSRSDRNYLVARLQRPDPRVNIGQKLAGLATAAVDISDGLIADVSHIAVTSQVGLVIELPGLPVSDAAKRVTGDDELKILSLMTTGEDYELAFTAPPHLAGDIRKCAATSGLPLTKIGTVVEGSGVVVRDRAGNDMEVKAAGWVHF
jgi:thiamine-monophosphate kinase